MHRHEIVGLCGPNGCGKSTLLESLAGHHRLSSGSLTGPGHAVLALQDPSSETSGTQGDACDVVVRLALLSKVPRLFALACEMEGGSWECAGDFQDQGGYDLVARAERWAVHFDLEELLESSFRHLSMGQKRRVELAASFGAHPDVLLLDEPTNGLDLRGLAQLEEALGLQRDRGAVLLVSHDRELCDRVCDRTLLMEQGAAERGAADVRTTEVLVEVRGGYTAARQLQQQTQDAKQHHARTLTAAIRALEAEARQRSQWSDRKEASKRGAGAAKPYIAKRAKRMMQRAKAAEHRAERKLAELREARPFVEKGLHLPLHTDAAPVRTVVRLAGAELPYGTRHPLDLVLRTTDKVGLLGENGAGKTTLLRALAGEIEPVRGDIQRGEVDSAWVRQDALETFEGRTLVEHFVQRGICANEARRLLGAMGVRGARPDAATTTLSMGERVRAALVHAALAEADFLFLDEPTAHLDVESIERLSDRLARSPQGFLLVSHDRRLLGDVCDRLYLLSSCGLQEVAPLGGNV